MDVLKDEDNKESIITVQDFPFICRICCLKRSDLRLFEDEYYLLDLFHTIRRIDVLSPVDYPKSICIECINKLQDISTYIDNLKYNDASFGRKINPKKENMEDTDEMNREMSRNSVEITDENEDMNIQGSQICRICSSSANSLTPFDEKMHLVQMYQNITNIDLAAEFNSSKMNDICKKCINELEKISSFAYDSLCNDQKLENAIERESYSNGIDIEPSTYQEMELESFIRKNEAITENTSEENSFFLKSEEDLEIIDIKEEVIDNELTNSTEEKYSNEMDVHSQMFPKEELPEQRNLDNNSDLTATKFKCNSCEKIFDLESSLVRHCLSHTVKKSLRCDSCKKSFARKSSLQQHMLIHSGEKLFKCDCCEKTFTQKGTLQQHMLIHSGKKPFKCDFCQKRFTQNGTLHKHMQIHYGEKLFKCGCCEKSFTDKGNLGKHMLIHSGEKPFKCDYCEKTFTLKGTLEKHKLVHSGENPFKCDCCEKSFTQKGTLQKHKLIHSGEKPFKCDCCEKSFTQKGTLHQHMIIHSGEKPFKCDFCQKSFTQRGTLQKHMLIHSGGKLFKCGCCEKSFTDKGNLQKHMLIHSGEKPFKCGCCEKRFTQKVTLQQHELIHSGEKPFRCDCCEKSFNQRWTLQKHKLIHSGKKVLSRVDYPKSVCIECINKLQDISTYIDNLKYNDASFGSKINPKKENIEDADEIERKISQDSVGTTDENKEKSSLQRYQMCRICSSLENCLTPFDKKMHLVQIYQNITNIDLGAEFNSSKMNGICKKCINGLEKISSFAYYSLCNDQKLENVIERESYSNGIDIKPSMKQEMKLESFIDKNEAITENTSEENSFFLKSENLEIIDIKEEVIDNELTNSTEEKYSNEMDVHSQMFPKEELPEEEPYSPQQQRNLDNNSDLTTTKSEKKTFECDYCEKSFTKKGTLQQHIVIHSGQKPFKCDCCQKSFTQKGTLHKHMLIHSGEKQFKCDCCEKSFSRKWTLQKHMLIHSGEKPFNCYYCKKSFTRNWTLQKHMLIHSSYCSEKSFTQKGNLQEHVPFSSGEKPFKCDGCQKSFRHVRSLKRHLLTHPRK